MVKTSRRIGGIKAKAYGQMFEDLFEMTCRKSGMALTSVPDSCKRLSQTKLIQVKSPFDWVLTHRGRTAVLDTKTTEHDTFSRSDISEHQVKELLIHEVAGGLGGYVVWFRKRNEVVFFPASLLDRILKKTEMNNALLSSQNSCAMLLGSGATFDLVKIFSVQ